MMSVTTSKTDSAGLKKIISSCKICKRESNHSTLEEYIRKGQDDDFWWQEHFQIMQCQGCDEISFRTTYANSENIFQTGPNEWDYDETINLYPNPMVSRHPIAELHHLPNKLRSIYGETVKSLNEGQPILAGIGIRAILETICKDKSAAGANLFQKIEGLTAMGALTSEGAAILHKVRTLGNTAAHEVKPHKESELGVAMTVVEHLIYQLYVLPKLAAATFD